MADIPQKLKYETILVPIFEYCFGTSDQHKVWEEFTEEEMASFKDDHYFTHANIKSNNSPIINLKIDWIRDETFLFNQIFNLVDRKVNILARKLGLLNNRKFLNSRYGIYDFYLNEEFINDKELMMEIVKEKGLNLKYASDELRNDKDIVKEAVKRDRMSIQFASEELKDDKEIVMIALESGEEAYNYASARLKNDNDLVVKTLLHTLKYPKRSQQSRVSEDKLREIFNNDRELLLKISKLNGSSTLKYASSELRNDKEFVLQVIQQLPDGFDYASDELKNDREFVKESVKVNGKCLHYASIEFRDDREIVELALKSYPSAIRFISDRFRNDIEFISNSIGKGGFLQLPTEFSNDREIVLESTKLFFNNFQKASDELKNDREFILQVVKHSPLALIYCSREFFKDREIAMAAISQDSHMIFGLLEQFFDDEEIIIKASQTPFKSQTALIKTYFNNKLSDRLKNDREFYKKCGGFFDSFPRKYQLDREIVMEALKTHPDLVLRNVYPLIATDRVLAMRIVKRDGLLLGKLPSKYRNDRELVSFAIQQNKEAFKFVSEELSNDLQILKLYNNLQ